MVTDGNSGNISPSGNNNDPLKTMMIHWPYNGANRDNNANGNNGADGDDDANEKWFQWQK